MLDRHQQLTTPQNHCQMRPHTMNSSSVAAPIILAVVCALIATAVNSQTDSCASSLNLNLDISIDTTTLHCISAWNSQNFILRYGQTGTSTWSFVLSAPDSDSYVAVGFSPNGNMVGSTAMVGWIPSGGAGIVKMYYLGGQSSQQVQVDQGNLQVVANSSQIMSQNSRKYMVFQLTSAGEPPSRLLYSIGPEGLVPTAPNYIMFEHREKVSTTMNYVTGQVTAKSSQSQLRRTHGTLNMLGWGILMIIGAIVARHCREWDPIWFYSHIAIQSTGFLLGVVAIICGFILDKRISADVGTHKALGIFILALGSLQVMAILARPDKESKVRKYWNWYHYTVGRILIVFAIANVFYGIHLGEKGKGWSVGYGVVIAILFTVSFALEFRLWMRK